MAELVHEKTPIWQAANDEHRHQHENDFEHSHLSEPALMFAPARLKAVRLCRPRHRAWLNRENWLFRRGETVLWLPRRPFGRMITAIGAGVRIIRCLHVQRWRIFISTLGFRFIFKARHMPPLPDLCRDDCVQPHKGDGDWQENKRKNDDVHIFALSIGGVEEEN